MNKRTHHGSSTWPGHPCCHIRHPAIDLIVLGSHEVRLRKKSQPPSTFDATAQGRGISANLRLLLVGELPRNTMVEMTTSSMPPECTHIALQPERSTFLQSKIGGSPHARIRSAHISLRVQRHRPTCNTYKKTRGEDRQLQRMAEARLLFM